MDKNQPNLSIIIATKNRSNYCFNVIKTILNFKYNNFELVIQDNSDDFELKNLVEKEIIDKRLIYNYTPPPLSSVGNFNIAIDLARGKYFCLIGDDDGINPEIFKLVEWANNNSIDAITPGLNLMYRWPDATPLLKGFENDNRSLSISSITGNIKSYKTDKSIRKLMKQGGQDYLNLHLPKLYHGVIKGEHLCKIKEQTGSFVGGLSPDIYLAVALTSFIEEVVEIDYPFTIPGVCKLSAERIVTQYQQLEDSIHFRDRGPYKWANQVPKFNSSKTIWADSALAALNDAKRLHLINSFNVHYLTVCLLKQFKDFEQEIKRNYFNHIGAKKEFHKHLSIILLFYFKITTKISDYVRRSKNKVRKIIMMKVFKQQVLLKNTQHFNNVQDIESATNILSNYLLVNQISIDNVIQKLNVYTSKKTI